MRHSLSITLVCICVAASAETWYDETTGYTWAYTLTADGKATIDAVTPTPTGQISVPAKLGDADVVSIGSRAFFNCLELSGATIPPTVTNIADIAFAHLTSLTNITLPSTMKSIGSSAFLGSGLQQIQIPMGISEIKNGTFADCRNLADVVMPESLRQIDQFAYSACSNLVTLSIPIGVTNIAGNAFSGCCGLKSVTVSGSLTLQGIFPDSYGDLSEVIIHEGVTNIGSCFIYCTNLTHVSLPKSLRSIGGCAFESCRNLTEILLPNGLSEIGPYAFQNCSTLASLSIPIGVKSIPDRLCGGCEALTSIEIPEGVTNIGYAAFENCRELATVVIPSSVTIWGGGIFTGCNKIRNVTIPSNFGMYQFPSYEEITSVTIADGSTNVAANAFAHCKKLNSVSLPSSVVSIGSYAFESCESLKSIIFPEGVTSIGRGAMNSCPNLQWMAFEGMPPEGLDSADIGRDTLIMYSADYMSYWKQAIVDCGFTSTQPFIPGQLSNGQSSASISSVSMVVTNVVIHYVQNSIAPEIVSLLPSQSYGFVTVITEVEGGAVSIPSSWKDNYPTFVDIYGLDFTKALTLKSGKRDSAGNEMFVWQDFVAGTDPTDVNDKFTASITLVNGVPVISYSPELTPEQTALRIYKIYGKTKLGDSTWHDVTNLTDTERAEYNFFKVSVRMK